MTGPWPRRLLLAACAALALTCLAGASGLFAPAPQRLNLPPAAEPVIYEPLRGAIDVNSAGLEALDALPGISPHIARLIDEHRKRSPFFYVEDLRIIPGIGEKRVEALRPLLRFD